MPREETPRWLSAAWSLLADHWNSLAAVLAVAMYLTASVFPGVPDDWKQAALVLGSTAAILTLIEIKKTLGNGSPDSSWYRSMRLARGEIVDSIRLQVSRKRRKPLTISVIGGRLRTISDMIIEVLEEMQSGVLQGSNVDFRIICLRPAAMREWAIDGLSNPERFRETSSLNASDLESQIRELLSFNSSSVLVERGVKVSVTTYEEFPSFYAFVIGDAEIFWGYYTWNADNEDFDGPVNPCARVARGDRSFEPLREWFLNRTEFLQVTSPDVAQLENRPSRTETLSHALRTNRVAYDALLAYYQLDERQRSERMQECLDPVYEEVSRRFNERISVLELGSADGALTAALCERDYEVSAIDFSPRMCASTSARAPSATLIQEEFLAHDFGSARYHLVVSVAFIHLFPTPWDEKVLRKIRDLLAPRGVAYLATTIHETNHEGYAAKMEPSEQPIRYRQHYTRERFESIVMRSGLRVINSFESEDVVTQGKRWMNLVVVAD